MSEIQDLQDWVGRSTVVEDLLSISTIANMNATLGRNFPEPINGALLPATWHWLFFNRGVAPSDLGPDGHAANAELSPPMPLPRRMWAGNKVHIQKPLTIGADAKCVTTIEEITEKSGKTGSLIFLQERSDITDDNGGSLVDRRTIVYREEAGKTGDSKPNPAPSEASWQRVVEPDPVLLFRYSALTFNSHRIHYDRDYTMNTEGYPALLVHGPLTATLLLDLFERELPDAQIAELNIRAMAPVFDNASFSLNGTLSEEDRAAKLWAATSGDDLAMKIDVQFA